ncbi:hypothetical protein COCNU_scaffold003161G000030 [Cocos nucifera]|nr:hypothetical protein [Cocos nucifera]
MKAQALWINKASWCLHNETNAKSDRRMQNNRKQARVVSCTQRFVLLEVYDLVDSFTIALTCLVLFLVGRSRT